MPRKGAKTKFDEEVVNLSKLLRNEHGEGGVLVSQHEFWVDFRASPGTRKAPKKAIFTFNLPSSTPAMIMIALANIVQVATSRGLDPFRISYPWAGQRCCFLRVRAVRAQQELRRAQEAELLAIAARTYFLSSNVEEFGYYGFLELFENRSRDHLIWMGGEAAKHSPGAKEAEGSPPEDVATLLSKDRVRYDRVLERALDPTAIDEDGYSSIPELLEQASLIDPTRKPHLRLSNRALARIKLDLSDRPPPCEVARLLLSKKKVALYNEKKFARSEQADDDSDFEDDDGEYTAAVPTPRFMHPALKELRMTSRSCRTTALRRTQRSLAGKAGALSASRASASLAVTC
ncbi:hypothetical protein PR003_g5135 [Phytophthora rubi]|uniref:Uncharacterized protein n=1 Tax=Phytophthora rubi TaxID=129364 RepID=A0A6A4FTP4_9STRA|nr:hypothetical protein PR003_g5135 [Phytophthora rubi]